MSPTVSPKERTWRPAPAELMRRFEQAIAVLPGAELRRMFGYPCAFVNGQMFAGVHQENIILRLPSKERAEIVQMSGGSLFEPQAGRPMREYVLLSPALHADEPFLEHWLEHARAYAASLPPKEPKPRRGSRA